ncbi:putative Transcriptional regulator, TetR family [Vibrio nigripulchritudo SO65]|uniref:TetR/AcrR family transcriptional regulator n=1 Tax=Vibrio nigripulchritudo TaxID=28173 RepID=UPI0003B1C489|nr:TetR/AcrR family transcriptional regulator [Vibrio nigripulchritudo]CCN38298.1 putative Transcriptional regulator, TetR family [Vibrio nigripulchritudo AM115]CCN43460.1 putative Transcriptional regulator, TetR family [Vibrio nigripulchritudo FTn2]CCN65768.1 putative Transcriptional regulator, TetR family [Vibrio nigripulchritudo POn4]CCN75314.1 putative Transcriptional regulator, TetR family [Vibrio nigripulchritudo SO65]
MSRIRKKNHDLIISVASECFAQNGYEATKIIDIAKAAEVPKANVFYYFSNKEKLYDAVLNTITKPLLDASKPLEELTDPVEALTQYIHTKLSISRDHPNASKVFANEVMSGGKMLPKEVSEKLLQQSLDMVEKFSDWVESGLMDEVSPHHLMFMLWASTQTYADFSWQICTVMNKTELEEADFEQAASFIAQMVIKGCGLRSAPAIS